MNDRPTSRLAADEVGARLRAHDPAAGASADEAASLDRLARRVRALEPATERRTGALWLLPVAAGLLVLAVVPRWPTSHVPTAPGAGDTASRAVADADDAEPRQIQFVTPGGTRVVWLLDSRPPL